jgi:[ribosomal protein S18]-alanine N-acetyltransferase
MIVEGSPYAALLAALHGAAFPPGECWDATAMAGLLEMPGCFACLQENAPRSPEKPFPCGMALLRVAADEAELLTVAVLPEARGQGMGAILLRRAMAEAVHRGARRMFLEVSPTNAAALALYCRLGFTQAGLRRRYYADGSDALVLSCTLAFKPCGSSPA